MQIKLRRWLGVAPNLQDFRTRQTELIQAHFGPAVKLTKIPPTLIVLVAQVVPCASWAYKFTFWPNYGSSRRMSLRCSTAQFYLVSVPLSRKVNISLCVTVEGALLISCEEYWASSQNKPQTFGNDPERLFFLYCMYFMEFNHIFPPKQLSRVCRAWYNWMSRVCFLQHYDAVHTLFFCRKPATSLRSKRLRPACIVDAHSGSCDLKVFCTSWRLQLKRRILSAKQTKNVA